MMSILWFLLAVGGLLFWAGVFAFIAGLLLGRITITKGSDKVERLHAILQERRRTRW